MALRLSFCLLFCVIALFSCKKSLSPPKENEVLDGPMANLTSVERARFFRGDAAFTEVFTAEMGLGSIFVSSSCAGCHSGDGKGHLSTMLTRFGQTDSSGNKFLSLGGPQLQHRALPGFAPESLPAGAAYSHFVAPAVTGLGLVSNVSDADLMALADPYDANGDGISGVPNWIELPHYLQPKDNAITRNGKYIGRFGKKASAYNLLHQTVNAYNQDMGITSVYNLHDVATGLEIDPELNTAKLHDLVFYLQTLKAPLPRNQEDPEVGRGKEIFSMIQCAACHVPQLKTSASGIAALSHQVFYPYSDFLLHDMGPGLDDKYTEGTALGSEWRTPALWGLGLSENSSGGQLFLLHDGRARSIEDAILYHGGEAHQSKMNYQNLSSGDKEALLKFLKSL